MKINSNSRILIVIILFLIFIVGITLLVIRYTFPDAFGQFIKTNEKDDVELIFLLYITTITTIAALLVLYVRGKSYSSTNVTNQNVNHLLRRSIIGDLRTYINNEFVEMRTEMAKTIEDEMAQFSYENILEKINSEEKSEFFQASKIRVMDSEFVDLKMKFNYEVNRLTKYAYVNLFIGFITTFSAIGVLSWTLTKDITPFIDKESAYLMHIIPRITLSILIEIFAFFFLKLYRDNINDIKYYNNEITNISMKIIAMKASVMYDSDGLAEVIQEFAMTERNFILKKGETTVELQKNVMGVKQSNKLIDSLTSILKVKTSK